jgi:hypothetical protein
MQGLKRIISLLLVLSIAISFFSIFNPASPAQAATTWQKNPANAAVIDVNLLSEPCVIYDNGVYKMWYTKSTESFDGVGNLITSLIADGSDFITHFRNQNVSIGDYAEAGAVIAHLIGLSGTDIGNLLR